MTETSSGQEQNQSFFGGGSPSDEVGLDMELHRPRNFLRFYFEFISSRKNAKKKKKTGPIFNYFDLHLGQ